MVREKISEIGSVYNKLYLVSSSSFCKAEIKQFQGGCCTQTLIFIETISYINWSKLFQHPFVLLAPLHIMAMISTTELCAMRKSTSFSLRKPLIFIVGSLFPHCEKPQRVVPCTCSPCHSLLHLSNNPFSDTLFSSWKIMYLVRPYIAANYPCRLLTTVEYLTLSDPAGTPYSKYA